jgi:hypothetical protein
MASYHHHHQQQQQHSLQARSGTNLQQQQQQQQHGLPDRHGYLRDYGDTIGCAAGCSALLLLLWRGR